MIAARLNEIDIWYKETHTDPKRPELLAKLATLEMCGWIEEEVDSIIRDVSAASVKDPTWTQDSVIKKNSGFTYDNHIRQMMGKLAGELLIRRIETALDATHPGSLAQLRNQLDQLWKKRCSLAHTPLPATLAQQSTLDAPSITVSNYTSVSALLSNLKTIAIAEAGKM